MLNTMHSITLRQRRQVAWILVPATILVLAGFFAARLSGDAALESSLDNFHWTVAYLAGALLAWLGVRQADDKNREARRWFAYSLTLCALGQLTWDVQVAIDWNPYPAPSDAMFLCFGPCAVYGMVKAIRGHGTNTSKTLLLDASILAVVVLTLVVAVYIPRNQRHGLQLAVSLIYPISMLAPACVAAAMAPTLKLRPTPQWLLFVLLSIVNGAMWMEWIYLSQGDELETNTWLYLVFSFGAMALGAGVLIWDLESNVSPAFERRCEWLLRMLPLFAVGGAAVSVALAWSLPNIKHTVAIAIYVGSGVMLLLAIVRQSLLLFERDRLLEMEKRAGELERTFQTLFQVTRGGLALLAPTGRFLEVNPACTALFGFTRDELLDMNIKDVDVGEHVVRLPGSLGLVDEQGSGTIESECRHKSGGIVQVEMTSALIPASGGRVFVIFRDITQRKQAEQQLRSMAQRLSLATKAAAIGIWELDLATMRMTWDVRMHELYRLHPKDFHGQFANCRSRIHPDDLAKLRAVFDETLAGRRNFHVEHRVVLPGGEERHVESHAILQTDAAGKPERMTGVNWDITERKRFEERQTRLEAQLRQSQKLEAIGTLASGIAHDFNNVLSAILGNIELALLEVDPKSPALTSLQEIRKAGQRGKDLIRRIVAFGRPQDQQAKLVRLSPVIADAIKFVRATLPATIDITAELAPETPPVLIDATQIPHLLLNLCTNAYQAMEDQRGRIEIRLDVREFAEEDTTLSADLHAGPYVCLHVSDNGSGIDPDIIERIFEPFFTTKPAGEGSGLGLSMAHSFVRAHGGAITVDSRHGAGTSFHIYLPAAADTFEVEAPVGVTLKQNDKGASQHILYVDDEEPLVFLTKRLLERLGYRVSGFTDPAAALAAFQADGASFDLVITDQSMPGMSGTELAREILRMKQDARIVLVSGYLRPREIEHARAIGIQEIVLKPDTVDELAAAVHRILAPKSVTAE